MPTRALLPGGLLKSEISCVCQNPVSLNKFPQKETAFLRIAA